MQPNVRRDLALCGEPDHVHGAVRIEVTARRSSNRTKLLSQYRPEYVIPQRCANAVVSRRKLMMDLVMLEQW